MVLQKNVHCQYLLWRLCCVHGRYGSVKWGAAMLKQEQLPQSWTHTVVENIVVCFSSKIYLNWI